MSNRDAISLPRICTYCKLPADGPMLAMASARAHADCVIRKLNELLDPDYDGTGEPKEIVRISGVPDFEGDRQTVTQSEVRDG